MEASENLRDKLRIHRTTMAVGGTNTVAVAAAVLLSVTILLTAAAVPTLTPYSPVDGFDEVEINPSIEASEYDGAPDDDRAPGGEQSEGVTVSGDSAIAGEAPADPDNELLLGVISLFGQFLEPLVGDLGLAADRDAVEHDGDQELDNGELLDSEAEEPPQEEQHDREDAEADRTTQQDEPEDELSDGGAAAGGDRDRHLAAALAAGVLGVLGIYLYRSERSVLAALQALPGRLIATFTSIVLSISTAVEAVVNIVGRATSVAAIPGLLYAALINAINDIRVSLPFGGSGTATSTTEATDSATSRHDVPPAREQIRVTWRTVVDTVSPHHRGRQTPGEIKRAAIEKGLPSEEVSTLTRVFRDVEYGSGSAESSLDTARDAADRLREHVGSEDQVTGEETPAEVDR